MAGGTRLDGAPSTIDKPQMTIPAASNSHDAFFKQLMSEPATAGLFLRERLPPPVAALLSPDLPELVPGSFLASTLCSALCRRS